MEVKVVEDVALRMAPDGKLVGQTKELDDDGSGAYGKIVDWAELTLGCVPEFGETSEIVDELSL
jgi:hypothetical protein